MAPTAPTEPKVGCCGLAGMSLSRYAEEFEVVELQSTFYRLPKPKTAKRWRESVRSDFEFTMKVFQGVTHPVSSPTWRRAGSQKPEAGPGGGGHRQRLPEKVERAILGHHDPGCAGSEVLLPGTGGFPVAGRHEQRPDVHGSAFPGQHPPLQRGASPGTGLCREP